MAKTHNDRQTLYDRGFCDGDIASAVGKSRSTITNWRRANGLRPNLAQGKKYDQSSPLSRPRPASTRLVRRFLTELGWGASSIAKVEGVTESSVKIWRRRQHVPSIAPNKRLSDRDKQKQLQDLSRRISHAIGQSLPPDIAADAAADLMLAVVEGKVALNQIEKEARSFGNRALDQYANSFRQSSLDEDIPNAEGLKKIDVLVDDASSVWLEEMGATCH